MRAFFWRALILSIIPIAAVTGACGDDGGESEGKVRVVTTLPLFADMVRQVGGERVDVTALYPSGADPHTFEPSPKDIAKIEEADVVFINGLDLEPAAENVIRPNVGSAPLIALAEEALDAGAEPLEGDGGSANPHVWLDVANGGRYAETITATLSEVDPEGAGEYAANFQEYLTALAGTDAYVQEAASKVPEAARKLVTPHDAFGYFARYIGFEVIGFVAPSPGQESSPGDVAELLQSVRDSGVPAVFTEPQTGAESRALEQIASDAGVAVCTLYSDSLDDEVKSYVDLMRYNADEIARCLGGGDD